MFEALRQLRWAVVAGTLLLTACASAPQSAQLLSQPHPLTAPLLASPVNLQQVAFFPQEAYQCGPAALATVLHSVDVDVLPEALVSQVYVPERQGSLQVEMLAAARRFGRLPYLLEPRLEDLLHEVRGGRPVLVMQNLGLNWYPQWHYAVVAGYDLSRGELMLRSGTVREYWMSLKVFERTWQRSEHWAFVALRPGELPLRGDEARYFESLAAFERVNDADAAALGYQAGLQQWPESRLLAMGLGNLHYGQKRLDEAAAVYRDLLQHSPDYAVAHNNLAQVLLERGEAGAALAHAQQAVDIGGRHADMFQSTLQQAMKAAGR